MGADKKTSAFYRDNARSLAARSSGVLNRTGDRLERTFEGCRKILDLGCGTGRDLAYLLRKGKDAFGVDASKDMLAAAHETLAAAGLLSRRLK